MARAIGKLTQLQVTKARAKGYLSDGGGLYLQIGNSGTKSWVFRYRDDRARLREMGLGPLHTVGLAQARDLAAECRRQRLAGVNPIEARRARRAEAKLAAARAMTFKQCAEQYIGAHIAGWRNEKHAAQWPSTLARYVYPIIGALPVQQVDTTLVVKILSPIWAIKTETAARLRGRIEAILDYASTSGYRKDENPARWRGHLENVLAAPSKVKRERHHAALPYAEVADFIAALRAQEGVAARAFEFAILTAARSGEVIGAKWAEINIGEKVWTVPADRMKAGREHRVPLSPRAIAILDEMKMFGQAVANRETAFVFPGRKRGAALSNMAFLMLLRRMVRTDITAHGFRSTFRDWAAEMTNFSREVAEKALAHVVENRVEAAYRRGELFEKRRRLMEAWARYLDSAKQPVGAKVLTLQGTR